MDAQRTPNTANISPSPQSTPKRSPFYKQRWFWMIVVLVIAAIVAGLYFGDVFDTESDPPATEGTDKSTSGDSRWLMRSLSVFNQTGATGVSGTVEYSAGSAVQQMTLMFFDEHVTPISYSHMDASANGMLSYKAPPATKFVGIGWTHMVDEPEDNALVMHDVFEEQTKVQIEAFLNGVTPIPTNSITTHLTEAQLALLPPVLESSKAIFDGRAMTGGLQHIAVCWNGIMNWSGVYLLHMKTPVPAGSRIRLHLYGRKGAELARVGTLGETGFTVIDWARGAEGSVLEEVDHPVPRVVTRKASDGGTFLEATLTRAAHRIFVEFTNDAWEHDLFLKEVELDGVSVWQQDKKQGDLIRMPFSPVVTTLTRDDPFHVWTQTGFVPGTSLAPRTLRRYYQVQYMVIGLGA